MRNILVHDYDGVNIGRVWDTEIEDIPVLRVAAEKYCKLTFSLNSKAQHRPSIKPAVINIAWDGFT